MESFTRSLMLLCFGGAVVLLSASWRADSKKSPSSTGETPPVAASPVTAPSAKTVRLVVDLSDRVVYLYRHDKISASYPVAIGQRGWETPTGTFKVQQKLRNPAWSQPITGEVIPAGANNPLGDRWISFWSDGRHQIGFHGTNKEYLVGQAITHGCLRMKNKDIRAMYEQVDMRTPVIVRK